MTIINVNLDTETHVVAPRNPTDEMCDVMLITSGNFNKYCAAITEAPLFTSLPNLDLDLIEIGLIEAERSLVILDEAYDSYIERGQISEEKINNAIAALKRIKGE